jgi:hypothetical protein
MRLTVGPLPAAVYWRRRAAVAAALALVIILFAVMCRGPGASTPHGQASARATASPVGPRIPDGPTSGSSSGASTDGSPGPDGSPITGSPAGGGTKGQSNDGSGSGDGTGGGGQVAPPVAATVPCADAEISLTAEVSPSPGVYGGVITLTLVVRNTASHACLRDVGSAPQELQVRQGSTVVWSSDHCNTPQASDVRSFGPNIESRFSLRWNTYRVAPHECDPPSNAEPAAVGSYQVVARLDTKLSAPVPFEIQK